MKQISDLYGLGTALVSLWLFLVLFLNMIGLIPNIIGIIGIFLVIITQIYYLWNRWKKS